MDRLLLKKQIFDGLSDGGADGSFLFLLIFLHECVTAAVIIVGESSGKTRRRLRCTGTGLRSKFHLHFLLHLKL